MKKLLKVTLVFIVALFVSTQVFAAEVASGDATMKLVKDEVAEETFGTYGWFQKKMTKIDTTNKTIDITLTVKNKAPKAENGSGEIVLLIDNSNSIAVNEVTVGNKTTTRKKLIIDAANELVTKLFAANEKVKIGVVEFATSTTVANEGTEEDAKIITEELSNDKDEVLTALATVSADKMGPRTDIEVGLMKAEELLATSDNEDAVKTIVVLTDAIPNTALGVQLDSYTEKSITPTKAALKKVADDGINLISMLIDISDDEIPFVSEAMKPAYPTYKETAEAVFGTASNPYVGKVYYVPAEDVTETVTETIFEDLKPASDNSLTNIVIKDYFPDNIIENFTYTVITKPTIGTVSEKIASDGSITWNIDKLMPGETSSLTYRLKLKPKFNGEIVGINLPTNKKVTIDYNENDEPGKTVETTKSPVVALDVEAKKVIPQTGTNTHVVAGFIVAALAIGSMSYIGIKKNS